MRSLLIRCYPARWRERYGDEFEALLEERPLGPFDAVDILLGALDARLRKRGRQASSGHGRGFTMSLRVGGYAAILGALLWPIAFVTGAQSVFAVAPFIPPLLGLVGMLVLLVAMTSLSAYQARTNPALAWAAFIIPALGMIACLVGIVGLHVTGASDPVRWGSEYFVLFALGGLTACIGSLLFAIGTYRAGTLSGPATGYLGVGAGIAIVAWLTVSVGLFLIAASVFCLGWLALGIRALGDRPSTTPRLI